MPYARLIKLFQQRFLLDGSHSANTLIYLCAMANEPDRRFKSADFMEMFGHTRKGAWNVIRRLEMTGLVLGGKLSEAGRAALIDPEEP